MKPAGACFVYQKKCALQMCYAKCSREKGAKALKKIC